MPTMASITVLDAAGASVIYNAAVASAGDKTPARWNQNAASAVAGFRPTFNCVTRDNGQGSARIMECNFMFPHTQTVSSIDSIAAKTTAKVSVTLPTNFDAAEVKDAFVQLGNLLVSSLLRQVAEEGYSPT